ncbi:MAG: TRAP transporter substrate-binding protein DctP [Prevotella sp.]|nr:TRAP transporter substrate-binding protein DctP [Prevotella sp.]
MKSSLCIILSLIMLLSLAACGQQSSTPAASKGESSTYTKPQRSFDGLILEGIDMSLPIDYKVETDGLDLGGYTPEKPLKLKAASYSKKDSDMQTLATQWLGAALEDISGGAIQVDVYTDKQMGADKEILDNVTTGVLDIGMNNCAIMYNVEPMYGLVDMEYLFKGWDHVYAFLNSDLNEEYSNLLQEKCNAICLGLGCNGFRCYSNNKNAVYKVSDCKGHLVRVMESEMFLKAFSAFGCNPITMPGSEVSSALQQKTIDGQDNSPMITYTAGYYEYQPYFSEIEHTAQIYGFTFTKAKDMELTINGNISFQRNKLLSLSGEYNGNYLEIAKYSTIAKLNGAGFHGGNNDVTYQIVGEPLGMFFLPKASGLAGDDTNGYTYRVVDIDDDKVVDTTNDRYICGQAMPKMLIGSNISFRYHDFDISMQVNGAFGHKIFNGTSLAYMNVTSFPLYNLLAEAPKANIKDQTVTDYWLENGDYVNIDYITLGWRVPLHKNRFVESMRLSLTMNNVATITGYSGLTPMINSSNVNSTLGLDDKYSYPLFHTYTIGLSLTF